MDSWYANETLQKRSSSDEGHSGFQSSDAVELDTVAVGSGVDVSYLESRVSLLDIRSDVGCIQHPSNPWAKRMEAV